MCKDKIEIIAESGKETEKGFMVIETDLNQNGIEISDKMLCFQSPIDKGTLALKWSKDLEAVFLLFEIPFKVVNSAD